MYLYYNMYYKLFLLYIPTYDTISALTDPVKFLKFRYRSASSVLQAIHEIRFIFYNSFTLPTLTTSRSLISVGSPVFIDIRKPFRVTGACGSEILISASARYIKKTHNDLYNTT